MAEPPLPRPAADGDEPGERLSHDQLRFLAQVRRRVPAAELRWHRRPGGVLVDVRARGRSGRERSVLIARLDAGGAVEIDAPLRRAA